MTASRPRVQPPAGSPRAASKMVRRQFTDTLKAKGVVGLDFGAITNSTYICMWGANASGLRRAWGLPPKANLRDHMTPVQLTATSLAEAMTAERLSETEYRSGEACRLAAIRCARIVRLMLDAYRQDPDGSSPAAANDSRAAERAA